MEMKTDQRFSGSTAYCKQKNGLENAGL